MATAPAAVRSPADVDDPRDLESQHVSPSELGEVTVDTEGDTPRITVPISSTEPHRSDGKIMTEEALESMAEQLESGEVGLWDDHGLSTLTGWREYRREDMFGKWVAGEVDQDGILWATAELLPDREATTTLLEQLDADMPVGFSVGYKPTDEEMLATGDNDEEKTRHIFDVDLWETSPVGIPDNPAAIASVAAELDRADADIGPKTASMIAASVREGLDTHMSETSDTDSTDSGDAPDAGDAGTDTADGDPPETRLSDTEVEEVMALVEEAATSMLADLEEGLRSMDDDGSDGDDDDDDDDEDESASTEPGAIDGAEAETLNELEERLNTLEERNAELEERLEAKEATIERLESETRESTGRKGISPAAAGEGDQDDGDGADESRSNRPDNVLDEAMRLGGN
jgi:hypothetical protein